MRMEPLADNKEQVTEATCSLVSCCPPLGWAGGGGTREGVIGISCLPGEGFQHSILSLKSTVPSAASSAVLCPNPCWRCQVPSPFPSPEQTLKFVSTQSGLLLPVQIPVVGRPCLKDHSLPLGGEAAGGRFLGVVLWLHRPGQYNQALQMAQYSGGTAHTLSITCMTHTTEDTAPHAHVLTHTCHSSQTYNMPHTLCDTHTVYSWFLSHIQNPPNTVHTPHTHCTLNTHAPQHTSLSPQHRSLPPHGTCT